LPSPAVRMPAFGQPARNLLQQRARSGRGPRSSASQPLHLPPPAPALSHNAPLARFAHRPVAQITNRFTSHGAAPGNRPLPPLPGRAPPRRARAFCYFFREHIRSAFVDMAGLPRQPAVYKRSGPPAPEDGAGLWPTPSSRPSARFREAMYAPAVPAPPLTISPVATPCPLPAASCRSAVRLCTPSRAGPDPAGPAPNRRTRVSLPILAPASTLAVFRSRWCIAPPGACRVRATPH